MHAARGRRTHAEVHLHHRLFLIALAVAALAADSASAESVTRISLTFLGDVMAHSLNIRMSDYRDIYRGVEKELQADDLTFANLETTVDDSQPTSGYPFFNVHRDYVRAAVQSGVEVFSTANNHAFDYGVEGVEATLQSFAAIRGETAGRVYSSGTRPDPARLFEPESIVVKGIRIGFIAVTQFINTGRASPYVNIVNYRSAREVEAFLPYVEALARSYDFLIVSYHGDQEYRAVPDPEMVRFFHRLVESGAHIVFSHHPHVLQPYELVYHEKGERLIMYSMGNFISGMIWKVDPKEPENPLAATADSVLLTVEVFLTSGGITMMRVQPVFIADYWNQRWQVVVGRLEDLASGATTVSKEWRAFYRQRLRILQDLMASDHFSATKR